MRRMDIGSTPFYGDFTVVFNSALAVQPAGCLHVGAAGFPLCLYSGCLCARYPLEGLGSHRTLRQRLLHNVLLLGWEVLGVKGSGTSQRPIS